MTDIKDLSKKLREKIFPAKNFSAVAMMIETDDLTLILNELDRLIEVEKSYDQLLADARELQKALESVKLNYQREHLNITSCDSCGDRVFQTLETFTKKYGSAE